MSADPQPPPPSSAGRAAAEPDTGRGGHAPPFYCPYCGEEDIRPDGEASGQWRCAACLRIWMLRMLGTAPRDGVRT